MGEGFPSACAAVEGRFSRNALGMQLYVQDDREHCRAPGRSARRRLISRLSVTTCAG
jgi:hypothetical protein